MGVFDTLGKQIGGPLGGIIGGIKVGVGYGPMAATVGGNSSDDEVAKLVEELLKKKRQPEEPAPVTSNPASVSPVYRYSPPAGGIGLRPGDMYANMGAPIASPFGPIR